MSRGVNRVILVGNVGRDPEIRDGDRDRSAMATFNLATTEKWNDKETTEWHRCTVWGALADVVDQYVRQGDKLAIVGRIRYREYEDRDGNRRWSTNINVDELVMLGGGGGRRDRDDDDRPRSRDREDDRGNVRAPDSPEPDGAEPEAGGATEDDIPERERPSGLPARAGRKAGSKSGSSPSGRPKGGRAKSRNRGAR